MPVHNLSDKTRFGALDSSGMTCCISDRFNRGSNVNTNVKWLRQRAVLNLRRRFFSSLLSFSFTEGVAEDHLPAQLEWGIVGNLSGCEIGRRHRCFDRVRRSNALCIRLCFSRQYVAWFSHHTLVRFITFSQFKGGESGSVCWPCESVYFLGVWRAVNTSEPLCVSIFLIRALLYLRDHWYVQTHMRLRVRFLSGDLYSHSAYAHMNTGSLRGLPWVCLTQTFISRSAHFCFGLLCATGLMR